MMNKLVLLRVGIDSGCGGIQGPLFSDGTFEFVCIPDKKKVSSHTYGSYVGRNGVPHATYFSVRQQARIADLHIHLDPEFETFTYGDPTTPKRSLKRLERGDYLVFYCGLQDWDKDGGWRTDIPPALYIVGYFVVESAGMANDFTKRTLRKEFGKNFHVRYPSVFEEQQEHLVLVKGGPQSRLLTKAHRISTIGVDRSGQPLKVLSPEMQKVFGTFGGKVSIQRSPPRWVELEFVEKAIQFVTDLD